MAGSTGLEPAASGLTVQCANQAAPRAHADQSVPRRAGRRTPPRLQRQLAAVVALRQLDACDAQLALLREHRQHRRDRALREAELAGDLRGRHRAVALQAALHLVVDLVPPTVHDPLPCSVFRTSRETITVTYAVDGGNP